MKKEFLMFFMVHGLCPILEAPQFAQFFARVFDMKNFLKSTKNVDFSESEASDMSPLN